MNGQPAPLWLYLPLWGVDFNSDDAGLVGGNVLASIPFPEEWHSIQQTEVARERRVLAGSLLPAPPACLTVVEQRVADESMGDAVQRVGPHMLTQARTAVLALRLHKPGWFLDPELAEICYAINEQGWDLLRRPGPYRQAFLAGCPYTPFPGYSLTMEELTLPGSEPGPVSVIWNQLVTMRAGADNASIEIALENFNRSYGFQLKPSQRLAHLFIALDALFGGFQETKPGGIELRGSSGKFSQRIKAALSMAGHTFMETNQQAGWLNGHQPGGGRWLRNRIAHGDDVDSTKEAEAAQLRLQDIVRVVLRQYIHFLLHWNQDRAGMLHRFNLPETCSPVGAFNAALAAPASPADAGAHDVLQWPTGH